jgi:AmmeMemoRadiSam system protein A
MVDEGEVCDHSVEIQLPLLQKAAPVAAVVPLYVGAMNETRRLAVARRVAAVLGPGDVLLASSDFTHYGRGFGYLPFPAGPDVALRLNQLDESAIEAAGSLDATLFLDAMRELEATVCGQAPIALLLETLALLGGEEIYQQTLDYRTSGEITGDFHHSVSYAALGYFRADSFELDAPAQAALLASARATLQRLNATGERRPIPPAEPLAAELARRCAVFVSLHQRGELFGCIGTRSVDAPLAETVPDLALSAALDDPRFPVRVNIPDDLDIEISVLTPLKRIRDWKSFRIGRHGAYLQHQTRAALLLPQVANCGYDATRFLEALSKKAGLGRAAYREASSRLFVFRAQVFSGSGA